MRRGPRLIVSTDEWTKLIRSQYGVDPTKEDPERMNALLSNWAHNNALLIKDIPFKTMNQVKDATVETLMSGRTTDDMTQEIYDIMSERTDVTDSRAKLIARDQVAKLNGALTQERQRDIGVDSYTWRTVGDERVRETHDEVDGQVFTWDNPPGETDGNHPGEDYQCRCWAEPILPEFIEMQAGLLEELEDA
jgi:SPP1 gp7 family putative phage head morphogenesis protein